MGKSEDDKRPTVRVHPVTRNGRIIQKENERVQTNEGDPILIRPCNFLFPDDNYERSEWGCVVFDGIYRVYVFPMPEDRWQEQPARFLHAALLTGGVDFRDLMRRAYLERRDVRIGKDRLVEWSEYETLFRNTSFYVPRNDRIIDDWRKQVPSLDDGERRNNGS